MTLYNCHHDGDQYRITKFIDGNPEASYLCTFSECECPAGHRDTCRHRQMLPTFLDQELVNSPWFIDWDRKTWPCDFSGRVVTPATVDLPAKQDTLLAEEIEALLDGLEKDYQRELQVKTTLPASSWRRI